MKKLKLTPWYPGNVKPVRVGIYERDFTGKYYEPVGYTKWTGEHWTASYDDLKTARLCFKYEHDEGRWQSLPWRGVRK